MPTFEVLGRGKSTGRKRRRLVRALDKATALELMTEDGTVVEQCTEQPFPPANEQLQSLVSQLGLSVSMRPNRPECAFEILKWSIANRHLVTITYLSDMAGSPWRPTIEPHGWHRAKQGVLLRWYLPPAEEEDEVVAAYQTSGWHLYSVEDIEEIEVSDGQFTPRPYRRESGKVVLEISFNRTTA